MTREDAKEYIIGLLGVGGSDGFDLNQKEALQMAISALEQPTDDDMISRQDVIELVKNSYYNLAESMNDTWAMIADVEHLPSVQPELTDDGAIEYLQSTGWMKNHDKEMYEMGLMERLADDSGSYDSLIPSGDTILRQDAIDAFKPYAEYESNRSNKDWVKRIEVILSDLPSAEPELPEWVQEVERMYNKALCKPYIQKPLAWALYEVWKKHDREDAERRTDDCQ